MPPDAGTRTPRRLTADKRRLEFWAQRGRGSVGRASPCQGEGRGFESRRPLGTRALVDQTGARVRWSGREARQRPAKPCTRVQIPSPPRLLAEHERGGGTGRQAGAGRLAQW